MWQDRVLVRLMLRTLLLVSSAVTCRSAESYDDAAAGAAGEGSTGGSAASEAGVGGEPDSRGAGANAQGGEGASGGEAVEPTSGHGGAGGSSVDGGGAGGAAGTEGGAGGACLQQREVECEDDGACDDGKSCNGNEVCQDSACVSGTAFACEREMECAEGSSGPECVYAERSPWLLYEGNDQGESPINIYGVPSALIGRVAPIPLSGGVLNAELPYNLFFKRWSPNGRYLVFDAVSTDWISEWKSRLYWIEFGDGLPTAPQPFDDLPAVGDFIMSTWDADSSALVVSNEGELYVVRFDGSRPAATLVLTSEEPLSYQLLCPGTETMILATEGQIFEADVRPGAPASALRAVELEPDTMSASPDSRVIVLSRSSGHDDTLSLLPCAEGAVSVPLVDHAHDWAWSPNSRYLAVPLSPGLDTATLAVWDVVAGSAEPVLSVPLSTDRVVWSSSSNRLLARLQSHSVTSEWRLIDVATGDVEVAPFDASVGTARAADGDHFVLEGSEDDFATSVAWIYQPDLDEVPRLIMRAPDEEVGPIEVSPGAAFAVYPRVVDRHSYVYRADLRAQEIEPEIALVTEGTGEYQFRGFSPDGMAAVFDYMGGTGGVWWVPSTREGFEPTLVNRGTVGSQSLLQPWP